MKKFIFKVILLCVLFTTISLSGKTETYDEIIDVTTKDLKKLKINEESIKATFRGIELQKTNFRNSNVEFEKAVKLDNKNYLAYFYLGTYERAVNNNPKKAIEYYEKAISVNPKTPLPYNNMAVAYAVLGDKKNHKNPLKN